MIRSNTRAAETDLARRSFLNSLLLLAGAAVVGCTPARAILKLYDARFESDRDLVDAYLRSFATTIIPGADPSQADLVRIFRDERFPFAGHVGLFTSDLARRSHARFGTDRFDELDAARRAMVVRDGLDADEITARLYRAAILATQVSYYGSIYDDDRGCELIAFPGANAGFSDDEMYYSETASMIGPSMTADGNPP